MSKEQAIKKVTLALVRFHPDKFNNVVGTNAKWNNLTKGPVQENGQRERVAGDTCDFFTQGQPKVLEFLQARQNEISDDLSTTEEYELDTDGKVIGYLINHHFDSENDNARYSIKGSGRMPRTQFDEKLAVRHASIKKERQEYKSIATEMLRASNRNKYWNDINNGSTNNFVAELDQQQNLAFRNNYPENMATIFCSHMAKLLVDRDATPDTITSFSKHLIAFADKQTGPQILQQLTDGLREAIAGKPAGTTPHQALTKAYRHCLTRRITYSLDVDFAQELAQSKADGGSPVTYKAILPDIADTLIGYSNNVIPYPAESITECKNLLIHTVNQIAEISALDQTFGDRINTRQLDQGITKITQAINAVTMAQQLQAKATHMRELADNPPHSFIFHKDRKIAKAGALEKLAKTFKDNPERALTFTDTEKLTLQMQSGFSANSDTRKSKSTTEFEKLATSFNIGPGR